jgi:phage-related protein
MPKMQVVFFKDATGKAPVVEWLTELLHENKKAWANCRARIEMLAAFGHELRRPASDFLRDGIYELRAKQGHVQYRVLYFFHGRNAAILAHALTKEHEVPNVDIGKAIARKKLFEINPKAHTYESET